MAERRWLLVLGASSGFGEAAVREFAAAGWDVFGVHLDRRTGQEHVEELAADLRAAGAEAHFFNINAADHDKRRAAIAEMQKLAAGRPVGVLLHSLAFGALKPFIADDEKDALSPQQMDMTLDVMAHSLVYWTQDLVRAGLLADGSRIYAMTSAGDRIIWKAYGAVSAAKCALESHIRQLAVELPDVRLESAHPAARRRARAGGHHRQRDQGRRDRHAGAAQDPGQRGDRRERPRAQPRRPSDHAGGRRTLPGRPLGARSRLAHRDRAAGRRRRGRRRLSRARGRNERRQPPPTARGAAGHPGNGPCCGPAPAPA